MSTAASHKAAARCVRPTAIHGVVKQLL